MTPKKHDFTKTMRNITIKENDKSEVKRKRFQETWILDCEIQPSDKIRLARYQQLELMFYNRLAETMNSYIRTRPEQFMVMIDRWEKLFGELAYCGADVRKIQFLKLDAKLPENLEPYRDLLLGNDASGKRRLNERTSIFMEPAGTRVDILPEIRKAMCVEVLIFCREQAARIDQKIPDSLKDEQVYKVSVEMLESYDVMRKRHNQIPRSALKIEYNIMKKMYYAQ